MNYKGDRCLILWKFVEREPWTSDIERRRKSFLFGRDNSRRLGKKKLHIKEEKHWEKKKP